MSVEPTTVTGDYLQANSPTHAYPFTWAWIIKANQISLNNGYMLTQFDAGDTSNYFWLRTSLTTNQLRVSLNDGVNSNASNSSGPTFDTVTWFYLMTIWRAHNDRQTYADGASVHTNTTANIDPATTVLRLFSNTAGVSGMDAKIASVACWNVDVGADGIAAHAAGIDPRLIRPNALINHWPLVHIDHLQDIVDGNTFVETGTVLTADHPRIFRAA